MALVYWQNITGDVGGANYWGGDSNPNGYWSAEPADGDVAVMGRGDAVISGSTVALVDFAELRIGNGFTGSIGYGSPMTMVGYGSIPVYRIHARGDVHLDLNDDATAAVGGRLIIDVGNNTVTVQDNRTVSQRLSTYTHTVEIVMRSSSSAVTIAQPAGGGQPNYSRLVATGVPGSTLTLTGATADDIYTDGVDVIGGSAAVQWCVLSGDIEPEGVVNLYMYGGSATPGKHSSGDEISYARLLGGSLNFADAEASVDLPDSWDDVEAYSGTVKMRDAQPMVNRGRAAIDVAAGVTLAVEAAEG